MKYLVFAGDVYYPGGGWSDFKGSFDELEEALVFISGLECEWWDIVDRETLEIVKRKL